MSYPTVEGARNRDVANGAKLSAALATIIAHPAGFETLAASLGIVELIIELIAPSIPISRSYFIIGLIHFGATFKAGKTAFTKKSFGPLFPKLIMSVILAIHPPISNPF